MGIKLVIVGGVAGGATAAARARRVSEDAEIVVFERGEYISFANCGLPYYIGNVIKKRDHLLLATPAKFKQRYNIDVRIFSEVVGINTKEKMRLRGKNTGKVMTSLFYLPGPNPSSRPWRALNWKIFFTFEIYPIQTESKRLWMNAIPNAPLWWAAALSASRWPKI